MTGIERKPEMSTLGFTQDDWDEVSDNPELTDAELAGLRPASEMPAEIFALLPKRGRGRPKVENAKVNITLRLDPQVIEAYRATGPGWQTRMQAWIARGASALAETAKGIGPAFELPEPMAARIKLKDEGSVEKKRGRGNGRRSAKNVA